MATIKLLRTPDRKQAWHAYGNFWPSVPTNIKDSGAVKLAIELEAFRVGLTPDQGGRGKFGHFKQICEWVFPSFEWNRWAVWAGERICQWRILGLTGCASCNKSSIMTLYALVSYLSDPPNTLIMVMTTTIKDAEQRIWSEFTDRFNEMKRGGVTSLKISLREHYIGMADTSIGKGKGSSIQLVAAGDKDRDNALQKLQGAKAGRYGKVILIWDEAQDCSISVFRAAANISNNVSFEFKCAGNAANRFDPHGMFCEPRYGWNTISVNDKEWEIVVEGEIGRCIHFDGFDSPNLDGRDDISYNDLGQPIFDKCDLSLVDKYPYIKRIGKIITDLEKGEKDPDFWRQCRGFWPPSDVEVDTIYPGADLQKFGALRRVVSWLISPIEVLGVDPAKGGADRFMVHHVKYGICKIDDIPRPFPVVFGHEKFNLKIEGATENSSQTRNMVLKVKELAERLNIPPYNVGIDGTALDAIGDSFRDNWSRDVLMVDFGGSPSELIFSKEDPRPCKDVFDRRVSELWFIGRQFLINQQLSGLDKDTARELSMRKYERKGKKISVETKETMRDRTNGTSPDDAEGYLIGLEVLRVRFKAVAGGGAPKQPSIYADLFGKTKKSVDTPKSYEFKSLKTMQNTVKRPDFQTGSMDGLQKFGRR